MEAPEILSWEALRERLTKIMAELPPYMAFGGKDPCALRILRLRDIAEWCGIGRKQLYFIRRGERTAQLFTPEVQRKLSWFFHQWDRGALAKEKQADGKWRLGYRNPQSQVPADAPDAGQARLSAQVSWLDGRLKVLPK